EGQAVGLHGGFGAVQVELDRAAAALAEDAGDGGFQRGAVVVEAAVGGGVGAVGRAGRLAAGGRLHPVQAARFEQRVHALVAVGVVGRRLGGDEAGHAGDRGALREPPIDPAARLLFEGVRDQVQQRLVVDAGAAVVLFGLVGE